MVIHSGDKFSTINQLLKTKRLVPGFLLANFLLLAFVVCVPTNAKAQLSVEVAPARLDTGYPVRRVYGGEVRAGRSSTLGFRHSGEIVRVHVREGDEVATGELLVELDAEPMQAELEQATARVSVADANLRSTESSTELALATLRRHDDLLQKGHTSAQRHDEVRLELANREAEQAVAEAEVQRSRAVERAAAVNLARTRIHAPYPARVQIRHADEGAMVVPGQAVLRIVEQGRREARVGLPAEVAATLETGAPYVFSSAGRNIAGTLLHLLPEVDGRTRTVTALFALDDQAPAAGSVIELRLTRTINEPGFWLPLGAISEAQRGLWSVFVVAEDHRVERRLVEVLHSDADRVFVRGTLADGDQIVTTGTQRIVPGQVVAASPAR